MIFKEYIFQPETSLKLSIYVPGVMLKQYLTIYHVHWQHPKVVTGYPSDVRTENW